MTSASAGTHAVLNQSTALSGHNVYSTDRALRDALAFHAPQTDDALRIELGAQMGDSAMQAHAFPPPASIAATTASASAALLRALTTTAAPASPSAIAMVRPMRRPAPVTMATRPASGSGFDMRLSPVRHERRRSRRAPPVYGVKHLRKRRPAYCRCMRNGEKGTQWG